MPRPSVEPPIAPPTSSAPLTYPGAPRIYLITPPLPCAGMASLLSSYSSSSILESSIASSMLGGAANNNSMQGLELAHLLGRGSFGWVYYGLW